VKKALTVLLGAVIAVALYVGTVESQPTGWIGNMVQDPDGTAVRFRAHDTYGFPGFIGVGPAVPTAANSGFPPTDGEIYVVRAAATEPDVQFWSANSSAWHSVAQVDLAETFNAAVAFTGATTHNGDVTLGSDEIDTVTVNAPMTRPIHRDDFCNVGVVQNDDTAESGTDTEINLIHTSQTRDGYYQFIEQTATLGLALEVAAGCGLDVSGDVTANDGHEIKFVRTPLLGVGRTLTGMAAFYFEISITITDISTFDGDWATGVMLPEAQQDPPQHDGLDTYVLFTLSDNAGDLDVEGDNGGGGETNDDTGVTWADGETHVLRIEISDDGTAAYVDGTAITLTNVNAASEWFDTGDPILPFYYHTQGAEGAASGVVINYVEWGTGEI
jgi:hypothetical protein